METSLDGMLGITPADLASNRDGRLSGRQSRRLWWSGVWRAIVGPPLVVFGAAADLVNDWFLLAFIGLICLLVGIYLIWRAFAFMADAATVDVAWLVGPLSRHLVRGKNSVTYYAAIGPVQKSVSSAAYDQLPVGTRCNLYYAPGCRSLLSVEPADAGSPRPEHPFGPDAAHAWDRLRIRWVTITVALFGIFAGVHIMVDAHPARAHIVSGQVSDFYTTTHKGSVTYHLFLAGDQTDYTPDSEDSYAPPLDSFQSLVGSTLDLYVNEGTTSVIAIRTNGDEIHAGTYYLHPEQELYWTLLGGGLLTLIAVITLLIAGLPLLRTARLPGGAVTAEDLSRVTPPTVRAVPLQAGVVGAVLLIAGVGTVAGLVALAGGLIRALST